MIPDAILNLFFGAAQSMVDWFPEIPPVSFNTLYASNIFDDVLRALNLFIPVVTLLSGVSIYLTALIGVLMWQATRKLKWW
jgi:hypothetical protein